MEGAAMGRGGGGGAGGEEEDEGVRVGAGTVAAHVGVEGEALVEASPRGSVGLEELVEEEGGERVRVGDEEGMRVG